jgi:hypothetical protein
MSNRRKTRLADQPSGGGVNDWFAALDGLRVPGGCDDCDAYQELVSAAYGVPGVHAIKIHHDDWCPTYARMQAAR